MELEEGELMEDAAAAGPPGTEAKPHEPLCLLFALFWLYHIVMCGNQLLSMTHDVGSAIFYIWIF